MESDKPEPIQVVAPKKRRFPSKWKKIGQIISIVLLGLVIAFGVNQLLIQRRQSAKQDNNQCNTNEMRDTIQRPARAAITSGNADDLKKAIDQIQAIKNYERDPNCMYPIVRYHILVEDAEEGKKALGTLESVYQANVGYAPQFSGAPSPKELGLRLEAIEKQKQEAIDNTFYGPEVSE